MGKLVIGSDLNRMLLQSHADCLLPCMSGALGLLS